MKKLFNFRPFFFLFLISICCVYACANLQNNKLFLLVFIFPIIFFIFLIYKKKYVLFSLSLVIIIFLSSYSFLYVKNFQDKSINNSYFILSGKINKINKVNETFYYLTLEDCVGIDKNSSQKSFMGNVSLGLSDYDGNFNLEINDKILFETYITSTSFFNENGEVNSFYVKNNIRFLAKNTNYNSLVCYKGDKGILEGMKSYNKDLLIANFGDETGELAFSVLYGDKSFVPQNILSTFKFSGVIHLFTVSGLHVGLIVSLIYFFLKKLKTNDIVNFIVCSCFLLLYCLICSFAPAVFRASVMAIVLLFSKLVFRKNDLLNSLSFSGIILLLFNPIMLFDVGFQMSFVAVFGILTIGSLARRIKVKNEILKYILNFAIISMSVELSLLPLLAKYYNFLPTWSLIANLFSIPLFSIFYPLLFITNLIVLICPYFCFIYFLPKAMLTVLIYINSLINLLPFATIRVESLGILYTIVWLFLHFFVSDYVLLNVKQKLFYSLPVVALLVVALII